MKLYSLLLSLMLYSSCAFADGVFPPMSQDKTESIELRVRTAKASLEMVKHYMGEIQIRSHEPEYVQDAVCQMMKFIWNIESCLGEPFSTDQ